MIAPASASAPGASSVARGLNISCRISPQRSSEQPLRNRVGSTVRVHWQHISQQKQDCTHLLLPMRPYEEGVV